MPAHTTLSLAIANQYFQSILPAINDNILHRVRTTALVKGKGSLHAEAPPSANDNSTSDQNDPTRDCHQRVVPRTERPTFSRSKTDAPRSSPVKLRLMNYSEVRDVLVADSDLRSEILFTVYQDFTNAVSKGVFKGPEDRALVFEFVRCRSIKAVRRRAKLLLRTVLATDNTTATDHIADEDSVIDEEVYDKRRMLLRLRPVLDSLTDDQRELLTAKFDCTLIDLARRRNENPVTIRGRVKRLHDRIVHSLRDECEVAVPGLVGRRA